MTRFITFFWGGGIFLTFGFLLPPDNCLMFCFSSVYPKLGSWVCIYPHIYIYIDLMCACVSVCLFSSNDPTEWVVFTLLKKSVSEASFVYPSIRSSLHKPLSLFEHMNCTTDSFFWEIEGLQSASSFLPLYFSFLNYYTICCVISSTEDKS